MELTIEELREFVSTMPENTIINIEFRDDAFDYDYEEGDCSEWYDDDWW